jgi:hypothetical protein
METYVLEPFGLDSTRGEECQIDHGPIAFRLLAVLPEEIIRVAARLKALNEPAHARPLGRNIEVLHQVGLLWSDLSYPPRQEALKVLPLLSHLSLAMVEREMEEMCRLLHRENLYRWIERELGDPQVMEAWQERDGFLIHRQPRGLIFHNLSGNAFLLPALCIIFGLLTKNTTLLKVATAEPYFGFRFAESLRMVSPEIASDIAVLYWSARDEACYHALFRQGLGAAVAWGDLRTVQTVSAFAGQYRTRFIDHGARFGLAVIDRITRQELPQVVRALARDIVPWEGYACISPPFIFVVEGEVKALEFAEALFPSMESMREESDLQASFSRNSATIANREYYFFHLEAEGRGKVLSSKNLGSTVIYSESPPALKDLEFCSGQMVMVCRATELENVYSALANNGLGKYCQAVAFHGQAGAEFLDRLSLAGISHVVRPGHLNDKEVGFSHDGIFNLQELTRLVTRSRL